MSPLIRIQREDFSLQDEIDALSVGRSDIGAVVSFTGLCRDEAGTLAALELEHYPGMAEAEIGRVAEEAVARWPLIGLVAIHRYGLIRPGEQIVLVLAASAHRRAAFEAADFMMVARARGVGTLRLLSHHALPNCLPHIITIVGLQLGYLIGGVLFTEVVFAWPGIGQSLYQAILGRDIAVVQACVLLIALSFVLINLAVDLFNSYLGNRTSHS